MNDQTQKLLQDLAVKLGTTVEHLWGVLIKQAMIVGIWKIFFLFFLFLTAVAGVVICRYVAGKGWFLESNTVFPARWVTGSLLVVVTIIAMIAFTAELSSASDILACFFNPEYWAMQQIGVVH